MDEGAPQIGVDEQHAVLARFAECERQVGGGERFPLVRYRARDHQRLEPLLNLKVVNRSGQPPVLLDGDGRRLFAHHELSFERRMMRTELTPVTSSRRNRRNLQIPEQPAKSAQPAQHIVTAGIGISQSPVRCILLGRLVLVSRG